MIEKKIGRYMNIRMGLTMSLVMSFIGSLLGNISSGHFSVPGWLISFAASFVFASILALLIGFIVPMKKINDGAERKFNLQNGTFKKSLIQGLISNLIYTPIIGLTMAALSVGVFALPNAKKGFDNELNGKKAALAAVEQQIANPGPDVDMGALKAEQGKLNGSINGMQKDEPTFKKLYVGSVAKGFPLEFLIALVAVMVMEPKFQKKAFEKYIPSYGEDSDDE